MLLFSVVFEGLETFYATETAVSQVDSWAQFRFDLEHEWAHSACQAPILLG